MSIKFEKVKYKHKLKEEVQYMTDILGIEFSNNYFELQKHGLLIIKVGYCWDGASGPTWDDKTNYESSCIHDALYQLMRLLVLVRKTHRKYADKVLRDVSIEKGMWKWRANAWYWAVRKYGKKYTYPSSAKIITVP